MHVAGLARILCMSFGQYHATTDDATYYRLVDNHSICSPICSISYVDEDPETSKQRIEGWITLAHRDV